jgi:uncharacterized protein (TIGR02301 family)
MRFFAALALLFILAVPAAAQPRPPSDRKVLMELSRTLGESHALRQLCRSPEDQYWRDRMIALVVAEQPEADFQDALQNAFKAGYDARRAQYASCTPAARAAESQSASRGAALARRLAG